MLLWLIGCTISKPLPDLGQCASYPEDGYDYGTIEIGTCISGTTGIQFKSDDTGAWHVLLTNSNPYVNFANGSLLSIPWDSIDLSKPVQYIHDLDPVAYPLPSFASDFVISNEDIAMVPVRESKGSRVRTDADFVHLIDVSNPHSPAASTRGTHGGSTIEVSSDPVDISIDNHTGFGFVGNRTSHDISIINTMRDPMQIVAPWPLEALGESTFFDSDGSGSMASLHRLETLDTFYADSLDAEEIEALNGLTDDVWTLDWIEGSWEFWIPSEETGYQRYAGVKGTSIHPQGFGSEFSTIESLLGLKVEDVFIWGAEAYFILDGKVAIADWSADDYRWNLRTATALVEEGLSFASPALVMGPNGLVLVLIATDDTGSWVTSAELDAGGNWRLGSALPLDLSVLSETDHLTSLSIVEEYGLNQWRLFATVSSEDGFSTLEQWRTQDWETWSSASSFSLEDSNISAPVISEEADRFRMWYATGTDNLWDIGYAESIDGEHWNDFGVILPLAFEGDAPRIGMQATPMSAFRLEGESAGYLGVIEIGESVVLDTQGWAMDIVVGQWLDTDTFAANSQGGLYISDHLREYTVVDMVDLGGTHRIGYIDEDGNTGIWVEPDSTNEDGMDSVQSPVLWQTDDTWHLVYSGLRNGISAIYERTSSDALTWSDATIILEGNSTWSSVEIEPTDYEVIDGVPTLLFAGFDGNKWNIGRATLDGDTWTADSAIWVDYGRPGSWDDSGIRDGKLVLEDEGWRLWYAGFDGTSWQIGSMLSRNTLRETMDWTHTETATLSTGWFHPEGARHPLPYTDGSQWFLNYAGSYEGVSRVGRAIGSVADTLRPVYRFPTLGDSIEFETQKGDDEGTTIPLSSSVTDTTTFGIGLTDIAVDTARGFLYASSKLMPHIAVIDIRDDSQGEFIDRNYLDEEARIVLPTSMGSAGFRQVLPHPDGEHLLAISDSPEAVYIINMSEVLDNNEDERIFDLQSSWIALPVGGEDDQGIKTRTSMGPGQMVLDPIYNRLFVSNFNANSISVIDLNIGTGVHIAEIQTEGENPYAMGLSPDSAHLIVGNYTGEVQNLVAHGTLSILDVDPNSSTAYTLLTKVVNK